jgi:hypothetical protein
MKHADRGQAPPRSDKARGNGLRRDTGKQASNSTAKPKGGRPEAQGIRVERNPSQRPPRWKAPAGYDALAELEKLFGPPLKPFRRGRE